MMAVFVILGLLLCVKAEGTPVFVQTGEDLLLDVQTPFTRTKNDRITWSLNVYREIAWLLNTRLRVDDSYSGRAELFAYNFSLLLKKVTKRDNGDYSASVYGYGNKEVAEYKVTVLDPVSPVSLTVNPNSSDSSKLKVTCGTEDSLIRATFTCDNQTCSEGRGEGAEFATPDASLRVYLEDDAIICKHSNEVSCEKDIIKIDDLCEKNSDLQDVSANISPCRVKIIVTSAGVIIMVFAVISVHIIEKVRKRK